MRYQPGHKAEVHQKIVKDASQRVRAEGLNGAAVAAVMRDTGLTHGGFYKHFGSKDDLLLESLQQAFRKSLKPWFVPPNRLPRGRHGRQLCKPTCAWKCANIPSAGAPWPHLHPN